MNRILLIAGSAVLLGVSVLLAIYGWTAAGGAEIGMHGWIALTLGVTLTVVVGGGLMALVFFSARYGYDDRAHFDDDDLNP